MSLGLFLSESYLERIFFFFFEVSQKMACRWPSFPYSLPSVYVCVRMSYSYKDTNYIGLGPTAMTSF